MTLIRLIWHSDRRNRQKYRLVWSWHKPSLLWLACENACMWHRKESHIWLACWITGFLIQSAHNTLTGLSYFTLFLWDGRHSRYPDVHKHWKSWVFHDTFPLKNCDIFAVDKLVSAIWWTNYAATLFLKEHIFLDTHWSKSPSMYKPTLMHGWSGRYGIDLSVRFSLLTLLKELYNVLSMKVM